MTRQVAGHDATERRGAGLSEYYAERGESPGQWLGSGLAGLGLEPRTVVTEAQMVALFGHGHHPLEAAMGQSIALGREFPTYSATTLRMEVAHAFSAYNRDRGLAWNAVIPAEERARIRSEVATRRFTERHGRTPLDSRELAGFLAEEGRAKPQAVAGYDLTFSPVKSVSALWALAPREVASEIEAAHHAAVRDVLGWLEREVAYTRTGTGGLRQVPVTGLIAAAFTHRDSRAGDPDLHTHVAVSNKVQATPGHGGRWLSLDGRMLYKAKVAACERYNTRLEAELIERLGVRFVERPSEPGKRPVREIEGVDELLLSRWSKRRIAIEMRTRRLAWRFEDDHGRPPTSIEVQALAQQANLETRSAKHAPRSEAEQRSAWRAEATRDLRGSPDAMVRSALGRASVAGPVDVATIGQRVVAALEESRATWQGWHVRSETERQTRAAGVRLADLDVTVEAVIGHVLTALSVRIDQPDGVVEPAALRRRDGASVYDVHGSTRYTSRRILEAEQTVLAAARRTDGRRLTPLQVGLALVEAAANRRTLDPSQVAMVTAMATSGARLQVAIAPAGTGKTTTMRVLADAWRSTGGDVVGFAPSAVAARELGRSTLGETDTLAKLRADLTAGLTTRLTAAVSPDTLVIIDEAGMAATGDLAAAVTFALGRGASVRLVGDDQQLASVAAGGLLRDLVHEAPAASLAVVHRFASPAEAAASLAVRAGDPSALGYYTDRQRIHVGDGLDTAYRAWQADRQRGLDSLLLAPTRHAVVSLNERARADRLAGSSPGRSVSLVDGSYASAGDVIVTRHNDRRLRLCDTDWVKNGDRWQVVRAHRDGSLSVARIGSRRRVRLPAEYVAAHVQLGYAATVHTAQGMTVDTSHTVLDGTESRQLLYVALTRGRAENHIYLLSADPGEDSGLPRHEPATPLDRLRVILARDGAQASATTALREAGDPALRLREAVLRYQDAVSLLVEHGHVDPGDMRFGPLPWLPAVPPGLGGTWDRYLRERSDLVSSLADEVALASATRAPSWAAGLPPKLTSEVAVWRAAYGVPDGDPRPSGPRIEGPGRDYQRAIDLLIAQIRGTSSATDWSVHMPTAVRDDRSYRQLSGRLSELQRDRNDVPALIQQALADSRPLPAENPADALWWRVVAGDASTPRPTPPPAVVPPPPKPSRSPDMPSYSHGRERGRSPSIGR